MKDGAIVCNSGHFNVEIDLDALAKLARRRAAIREFVEEFTLESGKKIIVKHHGMLERKVYPVPEHLDQEIAWLKLRSMGVKLDKLPPPSKRSTSSPGT